MSLVEDKTKQAAEAESKEKELLTLDHAVARVKSGDFDFKDPDEPENGFKIFYAKLAKHTLHIPVLDEEGKIRHQIDAVGRPMLANGRYVPMKRKICFTPVCLSATLGYLSSYKTNDPYEIKFIEKQRAESACDIMTVDEFKKDKNPQQYATEKKMKQMKAHYVEAIEAKDHALSNMNAELERLKEQMDKGKPKK